MSDLKSTGEAGKAAEQTEVQASGPAKKVLWETPKLEDVSVQVMAQPYIRFT